MNGTPKKQKLEKIPRGRKNDKEFLKQVQNVIFKEVQLKEKVLEN